MGDKRIKLIYFSTGDSEVRHINLSWKRLSLLTVGSFIIILFVVGSIFALFTDFYHNFKIESLNRVNAILTRQLNDMDSRVRDINKRMTELETQNNDLRVYINLPKIDEDIWKVGAGGTYNSNEYEFRFLSKETGDQALVIRMLLDKIERQLELAKKSQTDIDAAAVQNKQVWAHTPTIQPVPGRISERFGMRLDPFIEKVQPHNGIDIPAEIGTKIFAAADGVVDEVQLNYSHYKGYGKYIVIDHGNGYKTKYAHLNEVFVHKGETIKRWQVIAEVGNTGRSTGPHLHYEVHVDEQPVDPSRYVFD